MARAQIDAQIDADVAAGGRFPIVNVDDLDVTFGDARAVREELAGGRSPPVEQPVERPVEQLTNELPRH